MSHKITNLKNLVKVYGNKKSDVEISNMLGISIDDIKSQKREVLRDTMLSKIKKHRRF
ncbi:MAG: hypothetical protein JJT76_11775 [Clostridiaceae bacterium]|nr:hypothetical protein [Clostridiaceae bacterium]